MSDNGDRAPLKVLVVSAEVAPFAKVGGLADVAAALPQALKGMGHDVRVALPCYRMVDDHREGLTTRIEALPVPMGGRRNNASVLEGRLTADDDIPVYFVRNDYFFNRDELSGFRDDDERFILFSRAVLEMLPALDWFPDVIHCNDWQTGIIPNWLGATYRDDPRYQRIATVFTIHNLAYQGVFPPSTLKAAQLDDRGLLYPQIVPFRDKVNLLGRGVVFADVVNTVSEQYAREILTHEYGEQLEPLLNERKDRLFGIMNGIDVDLYNPATDPNLERQFDADRLDERKANKAALQRELGLPERADVPLFGAISRMIEQKGFGVMFPAVDQLLEQYEAQFVLLGMGDEEYERQAEKLAAKYPDKMKAFIKFDPPLAQRIYGGIDLFVAPAHSESGGVGQMIAMRYGAVPVVRHTGGLADTVQDYKPGQGGNGFVFGPYTTYALYRAMVRALDAYKDQDRWRELMRHDMGQDFSWGRSARKYVDLYRRAVEEHRKVAQA